MRSRVIIIKVKKYYNYQGKEFPVPSKGEILRFIRMFPPLLGAFHGIHCLGGTDFGLTKTYHKTILA